MVLGATGNVGSRLVELLADDPAVDEVIGASRRQPPTLPVGVEWRQVDLAREVPVDLLAGADAVVHLAWLFQPTRRPETTWAANVEGSQRLFQAAAAAEVRVLVHASSVGAYSPRRDLRPVDESWPTHGIPTAAYSREKSYVERLLDVFENRNPDVRVVRLRPAFIFRREASVQQRRLFLGPFAPTKLVSRTGLPILPDPGGLQLQALHTDDAAEAYRLALLRDVAGAFNIAAEPVLDMHMIGELLGARVLRVPAGLTRAAIAAAWAAHLVPAAPGLFDMVVKMPMLDASRARAELGWRPTHDSVAAVETLLEGMRTAKGGPTPPLDPATSGPLRSHELATGVGTRP